MYTVRSRYWITIPELFAGGNFTDRDQGEGFVLSANTTLSGAYECEVCSHAGTAFLSRSQIYFINWFRHPFFSGSFKGKNDGLLVEVGDLLSPLNNCMCFDPLFGTREINRYAKLSGWRKTF